MKEQKLVELWENIKFYEWLYQVSDLWRVKSLDKMRYNTHNKSYSEYKEKILKPRHSGRDGEYSRVALFKDWVITQRVVHRLVWQAFHWLDINDKKMLVLHKCEKLNENGFLNNWKDNLFLWNHSDNALDSVKKWRHYEARKNYWVERI